MRANAPVDEDYFKVLGKGTIAKRKAHFNKHGKKDDDDPSAYKFKVKNFYINGVTGVSNPTIEFIWYEFDNAVDGISLAYASANSDDWAVITQFQNLQNPLTSNRAVIDSNMIILASGVTYKFKLLTSANGVVYDPGSVTLYITIP